MMRKLSLLLTVVLLSGCASIMEMIPSFYDANQSMLIVDVRTSVDQLDCSQSQAPQVAKIKDALRKFELYSTSKGPRQHDVLVLVEPMQATVDEFYKRVVVKDGSKPYCELKKSLMATQAERASKAVLGRF